MQIIECENEDCKKHAEMKIGIRVLAQKGRDHYFCSINCAVIYIRKRGLKKYELLTDDADLQQEFLDLLNQ